MKKQNGLQQRCYEVWPWLPQFAALTQLKPGSWDLHARAKQIPGHRLQKTAQCAKTLTCMKAKKFCFLLLLNKLSQCSPGFLDDLELPIEAGLQLSGSLLLLWLQA